MNQARNPRIGIFGHYGNENLGDEAIVLASIQQLRALNPNVDLVLFSGKPSDSKARYGLPAHPIRWIPDTVRSPSEVVAIEVARKINHKGQPDAIPPSSVSFLKRSIRFLLTPLIWLKRLLEWLPPFFREFKFLAQSRRRIKELDLLVVAGSNQFLDIVDGPWGFPYTLLKWRLLANSVNTPMAFASVGAGPLDSTLSRIMVRWAIFAASYLSFRDSASKDLVCRDRRDARVMPDIAFGLASPPKPNHDRISHKIHVAVNPMPVYDARYWYVADSAKYLAYVATMTDFVQHALEHDFDVGLFPTQPKDEHVITDIERGLLERGVASEIVASLRVSLKTVDALTDYLEQTDAVVATRFHATLLGLLSGKPTIGVCYYRKASDLLNAFQQGHLAFDLDSVTSQELTSALSVALQNRQETRSRLESVCQTYRNQLGEQFRELLDLTVSREGASKSSRVVSRI